MGEAHLSRIAMGRGYVHKKGETLCSDMGRAFPPFPRGPYHHKEEMRMNIPCIEYGCPAKATYRSWCRKHMPEPYQGSDRSERLPKDWEQRRRYILRRDNFICYLCGGKGADGVDHVIPNDDDSYDNLKAVHDKVSPFCHRKKTANDVNTKKRQDKQAREEERIRRLRGMHKRRMNNNNR